MLRLPLAFESPFVGVGSQLRGDRPPERIAEALVFEASGVGNNPDAVSDVGRANGESRKTVPPRIEPERGQPSENSVKPPNKES